MSRKTSNKRKSDDRLLLEMQYALLRKKNVDLAKRLAEKEMECGQATRMAFMQQNAVTQRDSMIVCWKEKFKRILEDISSMSVYLANVGQECTDVLRDARSLGIAGLDEPGRTSPNKTQLVKPMVGGHTIVRPTIKLARVPSEHLFRLMNAGPSQNIEENEEENDENEDDEDVADEDDEEDDVEENENRLHTLNEEDEFQSYDSSPELQQSASSNAAPLLSGLFKDVKVYISPMRSNVSHKRGNSSTLLRPNTSNLHDNVSVGRSRNSIQGVTQRAKSSTSATQTAFDMSVTPTPSAYTSAENLTTEDHRNSVTVNETVTTNDTKDNLSIGANGDTTLHGTSLEASTFCQPDMSTSYQSEFTDEKSAPILSSSEVTNSFKHVNNRHEDYDPLEGPSTLLNNTESNKSIFTTIDNISGSIQNGSNVSNISDISSARVDHLNILNVVPCLVDNTSTPYTPPGSAKKRRFCEVIQENKENSFQQTPRNVTKRQVKKHPKKFSSNALTNLNLSKFPNCSVIMERLPVKILDSLTNKTSSNNSGTEDTPQRKISKASTSKNSDTIKSVGRPRRSKAAISMKEPSCRSKLRRSK